MSFSNITVFIKKAVFLTFVFMLTGLHLIFFQCLAWGNMYREYSQNLPSDIALELTFSGQEMCGLCEAVEKARSSVQDGVQAWLLNPSVYLTISIKPFKKRWSPVRVLIGILVDDPFPASNNNNSLDPPPPKVVA